MKELIQICSRFILQIASTFVKLLLYGDNSSDSKKSFKNDIIGEGGYQKC